MGLPIIGDLIDGVRSIVSEVVVDKDKKIQIDFQLSQLQDQAQARLDSLQQGQIDVDKIEAASGSLFVAGWRPAVGWVGAAGFAYATILHPFVDWASRMAGYKGVLPEIDSNLLITVLGGLLGLGAMRSYEKVKGVATNDYTSGAPAPSTTTTTVTTKGPQTTVSTTPNAVAPKKKHFHIF